MKSTHPTIIQGGMGIHVSSWKLARAVAETGQMGVVSGTAIDTIVSRVLQLGDTGGHVRRALDHFPFRDMAERVKDRFFIADGKAEHKPFKGIGMPHLTMTRAREELLIVANYVEVFLAREGHHGKIGINYLEKIQIPTLPSLFGAMLAGVHVVLMGAGIPTAIPGVLDGLAEGKAVSLKIYVEDNPSKDEYFAHFDPQDYIEGEMPAIQRPEFYAIVSSDIVAKTMERKASGYVDGYVVENYFAGGHNAPPRRDRTQPDAAPAYGDKDMPDLEKIRQIGKPFWLAGQFTTPEKLKEALAEGAQGVQVGTPFAYCDESGMDRDIKDEVIRQSVAGTLQIDTNFTASPTGYPFKIVRLAGERYTFEALETRTRVCDMGYLRTAYVNPEGNIGWRCPAEPIKDFVKKGGTEADAAGRACLCNGLASTVGFGQQRKDGVEIPILTSGDEVLHLGNFVKPNQTRYTAADVVNFLLS
ncbi:MAG: nitronate monooxygenase [Puniceicoccaceae bacterium]